MCQPEDKILLLGWLQFIKEAVNKVTCKPESIPESDRAEESKRGQG